MTIIEILELRAAELNAAKSAFELNRNNEVALVRYEAAYIAKREAFALYIANRNAFAAHFTERFNMPEITL